MIRIVDGAARTALLAGTVLVLVGAANLYSGSCPLTAAKGADKGTSCEAKVEKAAKAGGCGAQQYEACKAKCAKYRSACTTADGAKPKAACPMADGVKAKGECARKACDKRKAACTKADGEKVKAACPMAKNACAAGKAVAEVKVQETCPVMGGAINRQLYVDHGGKRVYVCCQGCIAPVKKDAEKFIKALESDGVTLETVKTKQT